MKHFFGLSYTIDGGSSFNADTRRAIQRNTPAAADQFEAMILRLLTTIDGNEEVGRHILRGLGLLGEIFIVPGTKLAANAVNPANALAQGFVGSGGTVGTGRGSGGIVFVNAKILAATSGAGGQQDAMLLHEIVHAVRITHGLFKPTPVMRYDDMEEFYAVMLTNIYVSSKYPGAPLRGDHGGELLHKPGYSSTAIGVVNNPGLEERKLYYFAMAHRDKLLKFISEMNALSLWLKDAKCKFNPLRVAYNGYDPNVEEADLPPAARRKQGYGPFVGPSFADAMDAALKKVKNPDIFRPSITDLF